MEKKKKIIIADDDQGILEAICMLLEFEGYEVTCLSNGDSLLELDGELPDLLLLDIWMSGSDGRNICRKLKANTVTQSIPIIMISASHEIGASALEAGANDFIAKPFEIGLLLDKVEKNIMKFN